MKEKTRRKIQKEQDLMQTLEFLKHSDGNYHHLSREQITQKEKYRLNTTDNMKGFIRKYLQLDDYNSDGGVLSERSKNSKKSSFIKADQEDD